MVKGSLDTNPIDVEGGSYTMARGYPKVADIGAMAGLTADYVVTNGTVKADATRANCKVVYVAPTAAGMAPTVTLSATSATCK
jgi:hypothetical protein